MAMCNSLLSLNVRGLREKKKRQEIFHWLKQLKNGENNMIFLQETHSEESDQVIWEKDWGSKIIMSHGSTNSRGVAILFPSKDDLQVESTNIDDNGRKIVLNLVHEKDEYCLINIYAPTQDRETDQIKFLNDLKEDIESNLAKKIIIGGDFNLPLEIIDKSNKNTNNSKANIKMHNIMETYDIIDIWRIQNPATKRFTWRRHRPLTQSRLDYWLIGADVCYNIKACDIKPSIKTDHSLITLSLLKNTDCSRGSGMWKFNAQLLKDPDYTGYMKGIIKMHCANIQPDTTHSQKWELVKMEIRNATIQYSKTQSYFSKEYENQLQNECQSLEKELDNDHNLETQAKLSSAKDKLERLNTIQTEGHRIRSKANYVEYNERGSRYFLNLEKYNAKIKNITRLKLDNNTETTMKDTILSELALFYTKLYTETEYSDSYENIFLNDQVPKLNNNEKEYCDKDITMEECTNAIRKMKINKSPGTDGLTSEFYQFFWDDVNILVYNSFLNAFEDETLSCEQRRGVLRLIPKKNKI